jgi:hypothetical protein
LKLILELQSALIPNWDLGRTSMYVQKLLNTRGGARPRLSRLGNLFAFWADCQKAKFFTVLLVMPPPLL